MKKLGSALSILATLALLLLLVPQAHAQSAGDATAPAADSASGADSWWSRWMNHVTEIQSRQPHWVTPLTTVTPRLEQELRGDYVRQDSAPSGRPLNNYGNGKGLELIPADNVEVIVNAPPYLEHVNSKAKDGFGDFSALVKYRLLSANEKEGDFILTAFFGVSIPSGAYKNGSTGTIYTPTIAAGKGFGPFDIQSTLGISIPDVDDIGESILWNTALQARVCRYFWPELEFNYTHFVGGKDGGEDQLFLTPGVLLGRFPLADRLGLTVGAGMQIAATSYHRYDHATVLSVRLPF